MEWTLEKVMMSLNEAIHNLDKKYPNRDQAHRAFGALMATVSYSPPKMLVRQKDGWVEITKHEE